MNDAVDEIDPPVDITGPGDPTIKLEDCWTFTYYLNEERETRKLGRYSFGSSCKICLLEAQSDPRLHLELLQTCRQIYAEAKDLPYALNTFESSLPFSKHRKLLMQGFQCYQYDIVVYGGEDSDDHDSSNNDEDEDWSDHPDGGNIHDDDWMDDTVSGIIHGDGDQSQDDRDGDDGEDCI